MRFTEPRATSLGLRSTVWDVEGVVRWIRCLPYVCVGYHEGLGDVKSVGQGH